MPDEFEWDRDGEMAQDFKDNLREMGLDEESIEAALDVVEEVETEGAAGFTITYEEPDDT